MTNLNSLFGAVALPEETVGLLTDVDIGEQIMGAMGVSADDVPGSEAIFVTMLIDDSGSIGDSGNTDYMIEGQNLVLDALADSNQKNDVLVNTVLLNGTLGAGYAFLDDAIRLNRSNYRPYGGTPLFSQSLVVLGSVLAKEQYFKMKGVACRSITLIATDGGNTDGVKVANVKALVDKLLQTENHIVAGMGIQDRYGTNFTDIFRSMGIADDWIMVAKGANPDELKKAIREKFRLFSQSARIASQTANLSKMIGFKP